MKKILLTLCFLCILDVYSHEFNPAHLVINEVDDVNNHYEATWMYTFKNIGRRAEINFPDECAVEYGDLYYQGKYINEKINLDCSTH